MTKKHDRRDIELIARGCLVVGGRLLLCRSVGGRIPYLPGGHVRFCEAARAALARELREELGWSVTVGRFLGGVEHAFLQEDVPHAELNLVFAVSLAETGGRPPSPESREPDIEFLWQPLADLTDSELEPVPCRHLVPAWLAADPVSDEPWASTIDG